jgi:hypothetical protein
MAITKLTPASLASTGAVPGTYGTSNKIPVLTVNAQGQITNIEELTINLSAATTSANGLMSSEDKLKLDSLVSQSYFFSQL